MHWINLCYGHLQQGLQLLTSNCDFLQLQTTANKCPALFWKNALPALGMIPGIAQKTQNKNKIQLHRNMHICPPNKNKESHGHHKQ